MLNRKQLPEAMMEKYLYENEHKSIITLTLNPLYIYLHLHFFKFDHV